MATSPHLEIESFVSKFLFLNYCGYDSDLRFINKNGILRVEFYASLGSVNPSSQESYQHRHVKPSVRRRRQRRKENRVNARNSSSLEPSNALSNLPTSTQPTTIDDLNSNLVVPESSVPQQKPLQDASYFIDSIPTSCQVDIADQADDLFTLDYSRLYQEDASRPHHRPPRVRVRRYTDDEMKHLLRSSYEMMTPDDQGHLFSSRCSGMGPTSKLS